MTFEQLKALVAEMEANNVPDHAEVLFKADGNSTPFTMEGYDVEFNFENSTVVFTGDVDWSKS